MRRQVVSTSGTSVSEIIPFDLNKKTFQVGIGAIVTGTATYTIQHTFDDVYSPTFSAATANWFSYDNSALINATTNQDGNYAFPCAAARVNQSAGTGSVTAVFLQTGV